MANVRLYQPLLLALAIALLPLSISMLAPSAAQAQDSTEIDFGSAVDDTSGTSDASFDVDFGDDLGDEFEDFGSADFEVEPLDPEAAAAAGAAMMGGMVCAGLIGLILGGIVAFITSDALAALPEQAREIPTWVPWLLLVPFVNIVAIFFVFIKVPRSLANHLAATGNTSLGDCGEKLGLWGAVLNLLCGPIGLILLIMSLLKINQARGIVKQTNAAV